MDLNLDEFNLSSPTEVERQDICVRLEGGADISSAFWSNVFSDAPSMFTKEDKSMLKRVFNPNLSDRYDEGDLFVPPDTGFAYVQRLRALVQEEEAVQQKRKGHFLSKEFDMKEPGPLFPLAWTSSVELSCDKAVKQSSLLHDRPDYKAQAHIFDQALKSAVPVFDKTAEDGTRFRIYRFGSLEVRTTQQYNAEESVGIVFSSRVPGESTKRPSVNDSDKLAKVTEYVEKGSNGFRCYVVVETQQKHSILVEELADGSLRLEDEPTDLEGRSALAKVVRSAACLPGRAAGDARACGRGVYGHVSGDMAESGFVTK